MTYWDFLQKIESTNRPKTSMRILFRMLDLYKSGENVVSKASLVDFLKTDPSPINKCANSLVDNGFIMQHELLIKPGRPEAHYELTPFSIDFFKL